MIKAKIMATQVSEPVTTVLHFENPLRETHHQNTTVLHPAPPPPLNAHGTMEQQIKHCRQKMQELQNRKRTNGQLSEVDLIRYLSYSLKNETLAGNLGHAQSLSFPASRISEEMGNAIPVRPQSSFGQFDHSFVLGPPPSRITPEAAPGLILQYESFRNAIAEKKGRSGLTTGDVFKYVLATAYYNQVRSNFGKAVDLTFFAQMHKINELIT